jgi:uncharacterized delta-60 repeat protein
MGAQKKIDGVWYGDVSIPYVKVSGSWKIAKSAWIKINEKWKSWFLQGGILDSKIGNSGFSNTVNAIAIQSDGKIIVGGSFSMFDEIVVNRIARLNIDGTLDAAFTTNTGTGATGTSVVINTIVVQPDGKILIGGAFSGFNGNSSARRLIRLNSDGTLDTDFTTNLGFGPGSNVNEVAIQPDAKILVCGPFTSFNGDTANRIVRINSNGTADTSFNTNLGSGANNTVNTVAIQSDGKVLIGGDFVNFNGTTVNRIARLSSTGTLDTAFTANTGTGVSNEIIKIKIQSDDKILVCGDFTAFNLIGASRFARLNSDGTLDTDFITNSQVGANASTVRAMAINSDGDIVIGGNFISFNSNTTNRIARFSVNGYLDTDFATNIGTAADNTVNAIAIQSDGKMLVGGSFEFFNDQQNLRLVRIGGGRASV